MSYILHLDTSAQLCTVLISKDGMVLSSETLNDSKEQSAKINGLISTVCTAAAIQLSELSAVSVCNGPGSYTGLRVGLATAKGICFSLSIPLLLHQKLELIAADFSQFPNRAVTLKAREGEVFAALYQENKLIAAPSHYFVEQLMGKLALIENIQIICNDESILTEHSFPVQYIDESGNFSIHNWAEIANLAYKSEEFSDLAYSEPYYMKAAFTTQPKK